MIEEYVPSNISVIRNYFFKVIYGLGIGHLLLRRNKKKGKVPVLVFHRIMPEYDPIWPGMHPRLFDKILVMLKKHYTIYPLKYLHSNSNVDLKNACFISFDDGYKDFLDYAYPILRRNSVSATLFVLPYNLSSHGYIWTAIIISFVKHYWFSEIRDFFLTHNQHIDFQDKFDDFNVNLNITKHLCKLQQVERQSIIDKLQQKFEKDNRLLEKELLTFDELKKLDVNYVEIASHSLTHPSFQEETDPLFIEQEMKDSKNSIEEHLKTEVNSFAFPFANYNQLSLQTAKKYYKLCFTKINQLIDLSKLSSDREYAFDLARFNIHHDSPEEVFLLINGFHQRFKS